jgi:chromosome segregation ATPase
MEIEALRQQILEEVQSQFETRLREARRQKAQLEEELESLSEKWRSERRRLNSEIDQLESSLNEARKNLKNSAGTKSSQEVSEPDESARQQSASGEALKIASLEWEGERSKLQAEISRLQVNVAELIERSNNPLRFPQAAKEDYEGKQRLRDNDFEDARAAWETEKSRLTAEVAKLKHTAGGKDPDDATAESLQTLLREANGSIERLDLELRKTREEATAVEETLNAELSTQSEELARLRAQLEQAQSETERIREDHEGTIRNGENEAEALRQKLAGEVTALREELEQVRRQETSWTETSSQLLESENEKKVLQQQLQQVNELMSAIRSEHADELTQLTAKFESARDEIARECKESEEKLERTRQDADSMKLKLTSQISELQAAERGRTATATETSVLTGEQVSSGPDLSFINEEVSRVEEMVQSLTEIMNNPSTDLSVVIRKNVERAEWGAYLKGILFSSGRGKKM